MFRFKKKLRQLNAEEREGFGEYYAQCWHSWALMMIRIYGGNNVS